MITNLIFHNLKGISGYSWLKLSKIDIGLVLNVHYKKRLFTILDREYPWTLIIDYNYDKEFYRKRKYSHGYYTGTALIKETDLTQAITRRYKSEQEVKDEIEQILQKYDQITDLIKTIQTIQNARTPNK